MPISLYIAKEENVVRETVGTKYDVEREGINSNPSITIGLK